MPKDFLLSPKNPSLCILLHYLIHQCQTDKALLYSRLQLFQLKLLVYFLCVWSAKIALYIQKCHFDNDKGFSKKNAFHLSSCVVHMCKLCKRIEEKEIACWDR